VHTHSVNFSLANCHEVGVECRQVHVGVSAHQKLEKLLEVVQLLGYESLCVFGDCFDEIVLLDPQRFPSAIKKFAKEVRSVNYVMNPCICFDLRTLWEIRCERHNISQ
jgi:hypothetical protein